jgi:4-carboxymuconolactone decarboxylase
MTDKNPWEEMMRTAQEMAKAFPAADAFTPEGFEKMMGTMPKDMMETFFGKTHNADGLDAKTRLLVTLAGLVMQGAQSEVVLRQTVRHAMEAGAQPQEIIETIGQMALFAGLPAVQRATQIAQPVLDEVAAAETQEGDA